MAQVTAIQDSWIETTLENLCLKIGSGATPRGGQESYKKQGISLIRSQNILNFSFSKKGLAFINDKQAKALSNVEVEKNDVLINITGDSVARVCIVPKNILPARVNQHVAILRANSKKLDYKFLHYFLLNPVFKRHLLLIANSGGTRNALTKADLEKLEIILPPLPEQSAIAAIISSLDDKIKLLRKQNKILKKTAQAIFEEWFGKYKIDSKLPDGWRIANLSKLNDHIKDNASPSKKPDEYYSHYSIPAFDKGQNPDFEKGSKILSNKYRIKEHSFLVSKLNPSTPRIWMIFKSKNNGICSTEFQVIKPKNTDFFSFVYSVLNSKNFTQKLASKAQGTSSSHQRVRPQDILELEIVVPDDLKIQKYQQLVFPILEKIDQNKSQIQTLSTLRNTLLPQLIRGDIRVRL